MTGAELQTALSELGYTHQSFAEYIGAHRVTVSEWCQERPMPPKYVERIIELLLERLAAT